MTSVPGVPGVYQDFYKFIFLKGYQTGGTPGTPPGTGCKYARCQEVIEPEEDAENEKRDY